jgi:Domain of unknown function (DUF4372)
MAWILLVSKATKHSRQRMEPKPCAIGLRCFTPSSKPSRGSASIGLVEAQRGDYRDRRLSFWSQLVAMIYARLAGAQPLRELVAALGSHGNRFDHLGLAEVRRSTLADADRDRPASLFARCSTCSCRS